MASIIETTNLRRQYGALTVVHDLNLTIPEGAIYAFLGPNGAGKTTTIKMLLNIIDPSGGSSQLLGVDSGNLGPTEWQKIGYVSENQVLPEWMTIQQLINFCQPLYPTWDPSFCTKLLKDFDLPTDRKIKDLSRGMKMKVSLLTSLAYRPRLLVLDEPFTGLDPLVRDEFVRGILELTEQAHWTIFISSHDIDEVERLADWVGIINGGHLQLSASAESLQIQFQQIEVTLSEGMAKVPLSLPKNWLVPEIAGPYFSFVDSTFADLATTEAAVRRHLPNVLSLQAKPMALRNIFLALARTYRVQQSTGF